MTSSVAPDYTSRLDKVREALREPDLDALLVLGPANRRYLTGYTAADGAIGESSGAVVVMRDKAYLLVRPLYIEQARAESQAAEPVELELKHRFVKSISECLKEWGVQRLGFERDYTLYGFYEDLKEGLEGGELVPLKDTAEQFRLRKDEAEQATLREAARITDAAFTQVIGELRPGVTERSVARSLEEAMLELGADGVAFETIVAAGPNSARPHHESGSTTIRAGDPIVIDMGARYDGYCSDMTRSFCLGHADARYRELHALVLGANLQAEGAMRDGLSGKDADAVAREIIKQGGYEDKFFHGLGHGVGLDVHEAPHLYKESEDTLVSGMAVTVEPGIYISGWGGIRIEDTVIVSDGASEPLNLSPKDAVIG